MYSLNQAYRIVMHVDESDQCGEQYNGIFVMSNGNLVVSNESRVVSNVNFIYVFILPLLFIE